MRSRYYQIIIRVGEEDYETLVGASYDTQEEAEAEVERLEAANSWTQAYWIEFREEGGIEA